MNLVGGSHVDDPSGSVQPGLGAYPVFTAELKAKWLTALRSGKYKQGKQALSLGGKFCCLGVLKDVGKIPTSSTQALACNLAVNPDTAVVLPFATQKALWTMNDRDGFNFSEIAAYIEANVPAVDEQPRSETQPADQSESNPEVSTNEATSPRITNLGGGE